MRSGRPPSAIGGAGWCAPRATGKRGGRGWRRAGPCRCRGCSASGAGGRSRVRESLSLASARSRLNDDPRQPEKLRGRLEPGAIDGSFVDVEADVMLLGGDQIDHSAQLRELIHVGNGEDRSAVYCREDLVQIPALRGTDEKDFAAKRLLQPSQSPDGDGPSLHSLALDHVIQRRTKWILADDADD